MSRSGNQQHNLFCQQLCEAMCNDTYTSECFRISSTQENSLPCWRLWFKDVPFTKEGLIVGYIIEVHINILKI